MAQSQIVLKEFAVDLIQPIGFEHSADGRLFVIEKAGVIRQLSGDGAVTDELYLDIRDRVRSVEGERGLLGLAFHPDFIENGYFFVNYTGLSGDTKISRFQALPPDTDVVDPATEMVVMDIFQPFSNHNGGAIEFGPDGYLYIALGDGGSANDPLRRAQSGATFLGKMLRIDIDTMQSYRIPGDNPFVGNDDIRDEIWALGLRNPWRFTFDRITGDLWIGDVGQGEWEEINLQMAGSPGGENYGWNCYEADDPFIQLGCGQVSEYAFPVYQYGHEGRNCGGSVTGGYRYRGSAFPDLQGKYFFADYCKGRIMSLSPGELPGSWEVAVELAGSPFQYVSFGEDTLGELYIVALGEGKVYRIESATTLVDLVREEPLTIYPNPAGDMLFWRSELNGEFSWEISDLAGRIWRRGISGAVPVFQFNISELIPGLYIVTVRKETGMQMAKFLKF